MKKKLFLLFSVVVIFTACKREDPGAVLDAEGQRVLNILNGKWMRDEKNDIDTIEFKAFDKPRKMKYTSDEGVKIDIYFNGEYIEYKKGIPVGAPKYFKINSFPQEIATHITIGDEYYYIEPSNEYKYIIIDNNTIKLKDMWAYYPHFYKYIRIE